jgi:ribosomal protein L37E
MKEYFGWVQGSDMASVYIHLSGRDVDNALLTKVYGIKTPEHSTKDKTSPVKCTRCGKENPFTHKFCGLCGLPLSEEAAIEAIRDEQDRAYTDSAMDQLIRDSEFRAFMHKKLQEISPKPNASGPPSY